MSSPPPAPNPPRRISLKRVALPLLSAYLVLGVATTVFQRQLLYFPSRADSASQAALFALQPWRHQGAVIGYAREVPSPKRIWLMLHGNAGQAVDRTYTLPLFNPDDSVFILEYPGYGSRPGSPSQHAFNAAAQAGYEQLRQTYPLLPVNVLGESLGCGVACFLATLPRPPDRIALAVPFDRLTALTQEKLFFLPIGLMMFDRWDNSAALAGYRGRVDIYGARDDIVIPIHHAQTLAAQVKGSHFHLIECGHNVGLPRKSGHQIRRL